MICISNDIKKDVKLPSTKDFVARYPHYSVVETGERKLFDTIVTAENFIRAAAVTDSPVAEPSELSPIRF